MATEEIIISLDGMGGDNAPFSVVKACQMFSPSEKIKIILIGDEKQIKDKINLERYPFVILEHCENYIKMDDKINLKLLKEKDNSMVRTISMIKEGKAHCALSAGNTAAFVSYSISELGLIKNVDRPAIALLMPDTTGRGIIFIDAGANIKVKPLHLLQSAVMGALYAEYVFGIKNPRVALLNIGEEESKGDELRRESFALMSKSKRINFTGNVEGHSIFTQRADVIITDGFTGNVVLKVSEGVTRAFRTILMKEIQKSFKGKIGAFLMQDILRNFAKKADYAEYGGGLLLGVNGIVIISHGRSSPRAIYNAIKLGKKIVSSEFMEILKKDMETIQWEM
ncbi:MAG: phosphate acyltransferase PlsX [Candidatus Omnitrophica bacterium]|nr:phosphate acyltransferase PlsX [Candidatus Omnitrophota bacterium]MCM8777279.1 phosphate acyltransferase PlsX [Candidatus Omnitrophota bacterium]